MTVPIDRDPTRTAGIDTRSRSRPWRGYDGGFAYAGRGSPGRSRRVRAVRPVHLVPPATVHAGLHRSTRRRIRRPRFRLRRAPRTSSPRILSGSPRGREALPRAGSLSTTVPAGSTEDPVLALHRLRRTHAADVADVMAALGYRALGCLRRELWRRRSAWRSCATPRKGWPGWCSTGSMPPDARHRRRRSSNPPPPARSTEFDPRRARADVDLQRGYLAGESVEATARPGLMEELEDEPMRRAR